MSRRRRAAVLLGLSLLLGGLAASDVARRQSAFERRLGPLVPVLVTRTTAPAGAPLQPGTLALRRVPARFVPPESLGRAAQAAGLEPRVRLPPGGFVTAGVLRDPDAGPGAGTSRPGERVAQVVARGDPRLVVPGAHVDVLVTRGGDGDGGRTTLALQDVEVLDASPASADAGDSEATPGPRVAASLRVTVGQAVYLAAAESFAKDVRLLARAPGDDRRLRRPETAAMADRP